MTILEALKISKIIRRNCWCFGLFVNFNSTKPSVSNGEDWVGCYYEAITADDWQALLPLPPRDPVYIRYGGLDYEIIKEPLDIPEALGLPS